MTRNTRQRFLQGSLCSQRFRRTARFQGPIVTGTAVGGYALLGMTITGFTAPSTAVDLSGIINQNVAAGNIATGGNSSSSGSGGGSGGTMGLPDVNAGGGSSSPSSTGACRSPCFSSGGASPRRRSASR